MPFNDTPSSSGDDWSPKDHIGALVLWESYEYIPEVHTRFGVMPGARVLVTVIESSNRQEVGQTFDTMFFNAALTRLAKKCLDKGQFLGRLGQQQFTNGTGIVMEPPNDEDKDKATRFERWMADKQDGAGSTAASSTGGSSNGSQASPPPRPVETPSTAAPQTATVGGGGTYTDDEPPF